jgi:hypothetical protein
MPWNIRYFGDIEKAKGKRQKGKGQGKRKKGKGKGKWARMTLACFMLKKRRLLRGVPPKTGRDERQFRWPA